MMLEEVVAYLIAQYEQVKDKDYVDKPISYALYQTWKWADAHEKSRKRGR